MYYKYESGILSFSGEDEQLKGEFDQEFRIKIEGKQWPGHLYVFLATMARLAISVDNDQRDDYSKDHFLFKNPTRPESW